MSIVRNDMKTKTHSHGDWAGGRERKASEEYRYSRSEHLIRVSSEWMNEWGGSGAFRLCLFMLFVCWAVIVNNNTTRSHWECASVTVAHTKRSSSNSSSRQWQKLWTWLETSFQFGLAHDHTLLRSRPNAHAHNNWIDPQIMLDSQKLYRIALTSSNNWKQLRMKKKHRRSKQ